ncbi:MAG TPA: GntR family transcriptional regulator [Chthoniobacteraceae bacterium]|nr:GntR family transcriptional regulator [Chthoniobacteraceae bacterium]
MSKIDTLARSLGKRINAREWKPEEELPSRAVLSEEYGVSPSSVSIAIRKLQKEGMVNIVPGKGVFVVGPGAAGTRRQAVYPTIGLRSCNFMRNAKSDGRSAWETMRDLVNVGGVFEAADELHSPVLWIPGASDGLRMSRSYCESLNIQGVIIFSTSPTDLEEARELKNVGFPVVLANRPVGQTPLSYVDYDAKGEIREVIRRFVAAGHRRIAAISAHTVIPGYYRELKMDFVEALYAEGIHYNVDPYWQMITRDEGGGDLFAPAAEATRALLDLPEPPTAIFCWLPHIWKHVHNVLESRGLSVPGDISIACSGYHALEEVDVSGFIMPQRERGRALLEELHEMIRNPFHSVQRLLLCEFVDRGTIAPPGSSPS